LLVGSTDWAEAWRYAAADGAQGFAVRAVKWDSGYTSCTVYTGPQGAYRNTPVNAFPVGGVVSLLRLSGSQHISEHWSAGSKGLKGFSRAPVALLNPVIQGTGMFNASLVNPNRIYLDSTMFSGAGLYLFRWSKTTGVRDTIYPAYSGSYYDSASGLVTPRFVMLPDDALGTLFTAQGKLAGDGYYQPLYNGFSVRQWPSMSQSWGRKSGVFRIGLDETLAELDIPDSHFSWVGFGIEPLARSLVVSVGIAARVAGGMFAQVSVTKNEVAVLSVVSETSSSRTVSVRRDVRTDTFAAVIGSTTWTPVEILHTSGFSDTRNFIQLKSGGVLQPTFSNAAAPPVAASSGLQYSVLLPFRGGVVGQRGDVIERRSPGGVVVASCAVPGLGSLGMFPLDGPDGIIVFGGKRTLDGGATWSDFSIVSDGGTYLSDAKFYPLAT
jgi:hypothetical protein